MNNIVKDIQELLKDTDCKQISEMYARGLVTLPEAVQRMHEITQIKKGVTK